MINVTGFGGNNSSGGKKKTIFAGRPFETTTIQDVNNVTVSSIGSNSGVNEKRLKTKVYQ